MVGIDYKNNWYGDTKTIDHYQDFNSRDNDYWRMHYSDRWLKAVQYLPINTIMDKIELLDMGCGLGRSLQYFSKLNCHCTGIEPNIKAAEIAKLEGYKILNQTIEEVESPGLFDVVHIEQVLSHMPNYKVALQKSHDFLKDDGILIIEEPNDFSPLQLKLEAKYGQYWKTADHCNYFDYISMSAALNEAGFDVVCATCTYPMELFLLSGLDYIGNDKVGAELHKEVTKLLIGLGQESRQALLDSFAKLGWGRDLIMFAKKGVSNVAS